MYPLPVLKLIQPSAALSCQFRPGPTVLPAADLTGQWDVHIEYAAGASNHGLFLRQRGSDLDGAHRGDFVSRDLTGTIEGDTVKIRSNYGDLGICTRIVIMKNPDSFYVHPNALVESTAIGARTRIWAFAHVMPGAQIGADCNIGDHTFVENDVKIGDRVEVVPGYCPTTINLHEVYHVVENGVVVDLWPVLARGAGQG